MRKRDRDKMDRVMEDLNRTRKQAQDRMLANSKKRELEVVKENLERYWSKSR